MPKIAKDQVSCPDHGDENATRALVDGEYDDYGDYWNTYFYKCVLCEYSKIVEYDDDLQCVTCDGWKQKGRYWNNSFYCAGCFDIMRKNGTIGQNP